MKSQLQATVTDLHGKPVAFRAVSLGGGLMVQVGQRSVGGQLLPVPNLERVRAQDTLQATTPKSFMVDLHDGPMEFFTSSRDSIRVRVVVRHAPGSATSSVIASGRSVTLRLAKSVMVEGSVVMDTR
jgi:hypothetical protein